MHVMCRVIQRHITTYRPASDSPARTFAYAFTRSTDLMSKTRKLFFDS